MDGLQVLRARCPGISALHIHRGFAVQRVCLVWKFSTAEEATYPDDLCNKYAAVVAAELQVATPRTPHHALDRKRPLDSTDLHEEPPAKRQMLRASIGLFVRGHRFPPLVSEFAEKREIQVVGSGFPQKGAQITLESGHKAKVLKVNREIPGAPITIGVFRQPDEFIEDAFLAKHPIDLPSFLPESIVRNIFTLLTTPTESVMLDRLDKIKLMRSWAMECQKDNDLIHASLSAEQATVSKGKNFALLRKVLTHIGYPDEGLVDDLIAGTKVTGAVPTSNIFSRRDRPASSSIGQILETSQQNRCSVVGRISSSGDAEIDAAVYAETLEEEAKGWVSAPIDLAELESILGPDFVVAKRFGIRQSGRDYSAQQISLSIE